MSDKAFFHTLGSPEQFFVFEDAASGKLNCRNLFHIGFPIVDGSINRSKSGELLSLVVENDGLISDLPPVVGLSRGRPV